MKAKPRSALITAGDERISARVIDASSNDIATLWPTVSGYGIYDDLMYYVMTHDQARNARYTDAIRHVVRGKSVVDIGTGRDLNWARACLAAGASKVYAIEAMPETVAKARTTIKQLGLEASIILVAGLSTAVSLPERVDVCVSEIIESIGGGEGAVTVLNDARLRLLKPGGIMIPQRCVTYIAAAELPLALVTEPAFSRTSLHYIERIFSATGRPFDPLLSVSQFTSDGVISSSAVFEDLHFDHIALCNHRGHAQLTVRRKARMDGLALWINLWCQPDQQPIDSLKENVNWLPVFCPVIHPGLPVLEGDLVDLLWTVEVSDNGINPNYKIWGTVTRDVTQLSSFEYSAEHHGSLFRQNPFFQKLFS